MTTKEQERKALAKIRTIVAELGENSYIGTAFKGAWELAEQNIDDDAAFSVDFYKDFYYAADKDIKGLRTELERMTKRYEGADNERRRMEEMIDRERDEYHALECRSGVFESNLSAANYEIIQLKARLYDSMQSAG